uniref:Uncharacterized protein n=1 Tax=Anopheles dirus TaxID=7168 RepID=A0A182NAG0_9DIPT
MLSCGRRLLTLVLVGVAAAGDAAFQPGSDADLLISADGILNERLMPITYLMLDGDDAPSAECKADCPGRERAESRGQPDAELPLQDETNANDASFSGALSTLEFHRTMINLYRCKGFLARRIINVVPTQSQLLKRMSPGAMSNGSTSQDGTDAMLYDPGSSGYKAWLTKTSTLDDIYENFLGARPTLHNRSLLHQPAPGGPTSNPRLAQDDYFDEGLITGYAVQPDQQAPGGNYERYGGAYDAPDHPLLRQSKYQRGLLQGEASRGDYAFHHHHHGPVVEYEEKTVVGPDRGVGLGLKDLFDIALTTLAYLSFGMFILQVIMCVTMTKSDSGMMILPTTPEVEVEEEERRRVARALDPPDGAGARVRELNRLAMYAVDSVDAIGRAGPVSRPDQCLQACLCRANRFSRGLSSLHGYWVSVWSFGITWLARHRHASRNTPSFALQCISAALVGLGNGRCAELYPCARKRQL